MNGLVLHELYINSWLSVQVKHELMHISAPVFFYRPIINVYK